jgi:hypothetical protein
VLAERGTHGLVGQREQWIGPNCSRKIWTGR